MAVFTVSPGSFELDLGDLDFSLVSSVSNTSATGFRLNFSDGSYWAIGGSGFVFGGPNGLPSAGTIATIDSFEPGDALAIAVTGLSMPGSTFSNYVSGSNEVGFVTDVLSESDTVFGGGNADIVRGDASNDLLIGGAGNDTLSGEGEADVIVADGATAAAGGDTVFGGFGSDYVAAGGGIDQVYGAAGFDWVDGGDGGDLLYGGSDGDVLVGGDGADLLEGSDGNDFSSGGDGTDTLWAGTGVDWLDGGASNDDLAAGPGNDVAFGGAGDDVVRGFSGDDLLRGDDPFSGNGRDTLFGEDDADILLAGAGNDVLYGGNGNDTLFGDDGDDTHLAGTGDDLIVGGAGSDTVFYATTFATIASSADAITIDAGSDGIDTLIGIESVTNPFAPVIDLSSLTSVQGFAIQGDTQGDTAGRAVSSAGDINGDGFDDVLVGAPLHDGPEFEIGQVYVIFGHAGSFAFIDATSLTPDQGFIIHGDTLGDQTGWSVSGAGDINGDGFDDMILGAPRSDTAGFNAGSAWVIFGGAGTFGTVDGTGRSILDLDALASAQGFQILGQTDNDLAGRGVSSAGDVNGDGFDDLFVGAPYDGLGYATDGAGYVIFGSSGSFGTALDLNSFGGIKIVGDSFSDRAGYGVSTAGDVNGDGYDDMLIGSPRFIVSPGELAGAAYVVFGGPGVSGLVDLGLLTTLQGFRMDGDGTGARTGYSVATAGDVNGDGFDDIVIGSHLASGSVGAVYVVFGRAAGFANLDLTNLGTAGFAITGGASIQFLGFSVSGAGDVNGDGLDDILIGEPHGSGGIPSAGNAYLIYGRADGLANLNVESLTSTDGFIVRGDSIGDYAGRSVSAAGDVNGDGFDDIVVGAHIGGITEHDTGAAFVIFGAPTGSPAPVVASGGAGPDILLGNSSADTLSGSSEDVIRGGAGNDTIVIAEVDFADIDGGSGVDTLIMSGAGQELDLTFAARAELQDIERIDLGGSGANTLTSDPQGFFQLTDIRGAGVAALLVDGDADDAVHMSVDGGGWSLIGTTLVGGTTYERWIWDPDGGGPIAATADAELWIDDEVVAFFT